MTRILPPFIILAVVAAVAYAYLGRAPRTAQSVEMSSSAYVTPTLAQSYQNDTYRFSLEMPADFAAQSMPNDAGGETIVLQNASGDGVQIRVTPWDEDRGTGYTLTKERILRDVPDLAISSEQPVEVGSHYTGVAFKSDNAAFDGDSREVWFVFRGNLYQISTYARLDPVLQSMFATWKFQ